MINFFLGIINLIEGIRTAFSTFLASIGNFFSFYLPAAGTMVGAFGQIPVVGIFYSLVFWGTIVFICVDVFRDVF